MHYLTRSPYRLFHASILLLSAGLPLCAGMLPASPAAAFAAPADEDETSVSTATKSHVAAVRLPANTFRFTGKKEIAKYAAALAKLYGVEQGQLGELEVLAWQEGASARKELPAMLKQGGYGYATREPLQIDGGRIVPFVAAAPAEKGKLLALWVEQDKSLLLVWAAVGATKQESIPVRAAPERPQPAVKEPAASPTLDSEAISIDLPAQTYYVNSLKGAMPHIPQFPNLTKKPGVVRGYVYDSSGRPLKGAKLGVRSTAVGGFYSGASATTDEKGYYEIAAPTGVAHFYCAGYAVEHGEGLAAMALHPADGSMETFATPTGAVRNWVLLPYGIADRARAQDDPRAGSNYYGGTVVLGWSIDEGGIFSSPNYLPNQSTIELTLTPTGRLLDGSQGRTITLRKTVSTGTSNQLYINNIPAGPYRVTVKLVGGGPLKIRETGPYANRPFGLEPKQAMGQATLMLRPNSADAGMVPGGHGAWDQISLTLERP